MPRFNLEPFANLAWVNYRSDDMTENGGAAALKADSPEHQRNIIHLACVRTKRWSTGKDSAVTAVNWVGGISTTRLSEVGLRLPASSTPLQYRHGRSLHATAW